MLIFEPVGHVKTRGRAHDGFFLADAPNTGDQVFRRDLRAGVDAGDPLHERVRDAAVQNQVSLNLRPAQLCGQSVVRHEVHFFILVPRSGDRSPCPPGITVLRGCHLLEMIVAFVQVAECRNIVVIVHRRARLVGLDVIAAPDVKCLVNVGKSIKILRPVKALISRKRRHLIEIREGAVFCGGAVF